MAKAYIDEEEGGAAEARRMLEDLGPQHRARWVIQRGHESRPTRRIGDAGAPIDYFAFNPPGVWGAPYAVVRAEFTAGAQAPRYKSKGEGDSVPEALEDGTPNYLFMSHVGEELLIPTQGEVQYHWYHGREHTSPRYGFHEKPLHFGDIVRINPQVPHNGWSGSSEGARAWMVFWHPSRSPAASNIESDLPPTEESRSSGEIRLSEIYGTSSQNLAAYAFRATGISERLRLAREQVNCQTKDLEEYLGITSQTISRIEKATASVGLSQINDLAEALGVNLYECFAASNWVQERDSWKTVGEAVRCLSTPPIHNEGQPTEGQPGIPRRHRLHPYLVTLSGPMAPDPTQPFDSCEFRSYLPLEGKVKFTLKVRSHRDLTVEHILAPGDVLHLRRVFCTEDFLLTEIAPEDGLVTLIRIDHDPYRDCRTDSAGAME